MLRDAKSNWQSVRSGIFQGLVSGSVIFKVFTNDLESGTGRSLSRFVDNTSHRVGVLEGRAAAQSDWNTLEKRAAGNLMELQERQM